MKKLITSIAIAFCLTTQAQIITTVAGGGSNGLGDGGQATAAQLSLLNGASIDAAGNLYIADSFNNRVRKVDATGVITTFAGNGFSTGHPPTGAFSGDGGQATNAELNFPVATASDVFGNFYIVDADNYRIRKVNTAGIISTVAGTGTAGFSGDGGQATAAQIIPSSITLDATGNLYIADEGNSVVRKVNTAGIITSIAGNGTAGFSGDNGPATAAELNSPRGIIFDQAGNLYVSDIVTYRIRKINTAGIITTIAGNGFGAGTGQGGFSGDGGPATAAALNFPTGMAFDATGNLYFSDMDNNRVRKINTAGIITTVAGNGVGVGTICIFPNCFSGDGGPATAAELDYPEGLAFDATGNLYIADSNNSRVRKINFSNAAGIEPITNNNEQVVIYPNPTSTNFTIETSSDDKQTLQLFDVNGKLVLNQAITGKTNIDASNLAEGVYNLSLINQNGVVNKRLVIIK
ncbi:MAG TPA: T9SS type A sorting domain-containing protein [Bacteroidia bacterium]|nr:T9SS type A sorting domain-containing protein [Bacteroidia bacterium]